MANSVITLFKAKCKNVLDSGPNLLVFPNIGEGDKAKVRSSFQLDLNETILFVADDSFWSTRNQGLVITDWGITCIPDKSNLETMVKFSWQQVNHAQYKELNIYFFDAEGNNLPIGINYFFFKSNESYLAQKGTSLAAAFTEIAKSVEPEQDPIDEMDEEVNRMLRGENPEQAIAALKSYINNDDGTYKAYWYYRLSQLSNCDEAFQACTEGLNYCEDGSPISVWLHYARASAMLPLAVDSGKYADIRKECFHITLIATDETRGDGVLVLDDSKRDFDDMDKEYCESFLSLPYNERKILVPVKEYTDLGQGRVSVIKIDRLPSELEFPIGHPVANQVYVGHPFLPHKYIPFENYQLELVEDKVREFCQIAQCLGATEISIDTENSSQSNGTRNYTQDINGGISHKGTNIDVSRNRSGNRSLIEEISQAINLHQTFVPTKAPYLPEKTVWFQNEPSWQRLYEQRMNGGLTQHEERIETRKNQVVDNHELQEVKAELQCLFASANLNWNTSMDESFSQQENAVLSINVKFAPIESIGNNNQPQTRASSLTDSEQEYLDTLKDSFEEGDLSPRERKMLERIRVSLGISEERAKEIEALLIGKPITEDEQEYIDMYKEYLEEGEITEKVRHRLEKFAMALGISQDRINELERLSK